MPKTGVSASLMALSAAPAAYYTSILARGILGGVAFFMLSNSFVASACEMRAGGTPSIGALVGLPSRVFRTSFDFLK
jgi:hypothetical protein